MLDYTKMDSVLDKLDEGANSIKSLGETQKQIEYAITELDRCRNESEQTKSAIEAIENQHKVLNFNIERVMQDYRKVNSSFELVEIELKKNSAMASDNHREVKTLIKAESEERKAQSEKAERELSVVKKQNKNLKIGLFATLGVSVVTLVCSIIGFFI